MLNVILVLVLIASLVMLIVGMFKPQTVIRWGEVKTRSRVLMIYGGVFVAMFILIGVIGDDVDKSVSKSPITTASAKKVESQTAPVSGELKLNQTDAKNKIIAWLGDHIFPNSPKLSLDNGSLYEGKDGKKYYLFTLTGLNKAADLLVDANSGELFYHDINVAPKDINKWYIEYRKNYDKAQPAQSSNEVRINDQFAWVETPKVIDGYIVGKVRNITNEEMPVAYIEFNLFDHQGNQVGTLPAQVNNLKPGAVWRFTALIYIDGVARYELQKVKGYKW